MDPRVILCRFGLHPSITISGEPLPFSILFVSSLFIEHTYVRACCCLPGSTYRKHITAQPIKRAQSSRASTCSRSARDNACQQTKKKMARASMSSSNIYTAARCIKTNERRRHIEICPPVAKKKQKKNVLVGALGICKSQVCIYNPQLLCPLHSHVAVFLL